MNMELVTLYATLIVGLVGLLAFLVSVITQIFKDVGAFKYVPTGIFVLLLSVLITVITFVAYMDYVQQVIIWYMFIAAVLAGFVVAFVAMYGWEKLSELWKRFWKDPETRVHK